MKRVATQGFTLIELLVVITIIGFLSAVVLASLSSSRDKGSDAAVKTNMHSLANQAEIFYNSVTGNFSYGTQAWTNTFNPCNPDNTSSGMFNDPIIEKMFVAADSANGNGIIVCASNSNSYVFLTQLVSDNMKYWCIDSRGNSKIVTTHPGSGAGGYLVGGVYGCHPV